MYSEHDLSLIHQELQALCPANLVLLGGSYWYGGVIDQSDLDFYVILPWHAWLTYPRLKNKLREFKTKYSQAAIMLVPKILFNHAWYYVVGKNLTGTVYCQFNKNFFLRQTLKIAWLNYLRNDWFKCAQGLAGLWLVSKNYIKQPIMKQQNLIDGLVKTKAPQFINELLSAKQNSSPLTEKQTASYQLDYLNLLNYFYSELMASWRFSLTSYLVYNLKFLAEGKFNFLFNDPDKIILNAFHNRPDYEKMNQVAFPVLVI